MTAATKSGRFKSSPERQAMKFKNTAIIPHTVSKKRILLSGILSTAVFLSGCNSNPLQETNSNDLLLTKVKNTPIEHHPSPDITEDTIQKALPKEVFYPNIWNEMSQHFDLADHYHGKYENYLAFYNDRKRHLEKVSERAKPYLYYIFNEVKKREMPYEIALLPIVESGFRADARSHQRAVGLWQFIPSTAEIFNLDRNWWFDGRKDVILSTNAALDYLEKLYKLNNDDWLLALASYNAGLGNVYRAQKKYRKKHANQAGIESYQPNYWDIQSYLPKETQGYVPKLLAVSHIIEHADLFGVEIEAVDNEPFFTQIELDKQIALAQVASISETPKALLELLNPGYHRPATPPNGPYHILLPSDKAERFQAELSKNSEMFDIQWAKHKIRPGDSLSVIAERYQTSGNAIKKLNGMKTSKIRAGKTLLIPIPADSVQHISKQTRLAENKTSTAKPNTEQGVHIVKSGDSLWKLAKEYHVSTADIANWNNISARQPLKLGQKLRIYSDKFGVKIEHTLKKGESLWTLAKKYKVTTNKIAQWNKISPKKVLQPGMKLLVWTKSSNYAKTGAYEYIVKSGDNLWVIAKANKISAKQLATHNKLSLKSLLKPGQVLKIPVEG